jgi:hypothetical protein
MIGLGLIGLVLFWVYKLVTYEYDPSHDDDDSFV